jgi:hypothetical protein
MRTANLGPPWACLVSSVKGAPRGSTHGNAPNVAPLIRRCWYSITIPCWFRSRRKGFGDRYASCPRPSRAREEPLAIRPPEARGSLRVHPPECPQKGIITLSNAPQPISRRVPSVASLFDTIHLPAYLLAEPGTPRWPTAPARLCADSAGEGAAPTRGRTWLHRQGDASHGTRLSRRCGRLLHAPMSSSSFRKGPWREARLLSRKRGSAGPDRGARGPRAKITFGGPRFFFVQWAP